MSPFDNVVGVDGAYTDASKLLSAGGLMLSDGSEYLNVYYTGNNTPFAEFAAVLYVPVSSPAIDTQNDGNSCYFTGGPTSYCSYTATGEFKLAALNPGAISASAVPEPASVALLLSGLVGFIATRRRRAGSATA